MSRRPRLLVLSQTHNLWGGIETWMKELFPGLDADGWDIRFGLARGARFNDPEPFLREHGYMRQWRALDGRLGTSTSRQQAILSELESTDPDVVMPLAVGDTLPALREHRARGGSARVLVPVHSTHTGTLADVRENGDLVDGVGVVSGLLYRWTEHALGPDSGRVFWVKNGVPPPVRRRSRSDDGALRIGFVGRLDGDIKRAHDLLGIAQELGRSGDRVRITIAGDGPLANELKAGLEQCGLPHEMLGFVPRGRLYEQVYPVLDCLLLTSVTEGSPLAVIEAMRHGVVPVTSRFHGHASEGLLRPGTNCLTFPVGDPVAAARSLASLMNDPVLLEELSAASAEDSRSYDSTTMISEWGRALRAVLDALPREPRRNAVGAVRPAHGRLERWGVPASVTDRLRRWSGRRFAHPSGFTEWPGSLSGDVDLEERIRKELVEIEEAQALALYAQSTAPNRPAVEAARG